MKQCQPIKVFEYTQLRVGHEPNFTEAHFQSLVKYNERHRNKYFVVGHRRIHFQNYVGVIQVGDLTIEILPKTDNTPDDEDAKKKWQEALIQMIQRAGIIKLTSLSDAMLRIRSATLLDIFFEAFLSEVSLLAHQGLARKYRKERGNVTALKGRLLFKEQIAQNLVHRERFFTEHIQYDRNNLFNQILCLALDTVIKMSVNPHLTPHARALSFHFDDVDRITVTENTFKRLTYSRNTERYNRAIQLARLIILDYCPDVQSGGMDVLAILFNMNELFERYVFAELRRAVWQQDENITIQKQVGRRFWYASSINKDIRPDIVTNVGSGQKPIILDTKWKIPRDRRPNDADLKQMYTYNLQFGAAHSMLIYPKVSDSVDIKGCFEKSVFFEEKLSCEMSFIELFKDDVLDKDIGSRILEKIKGYSESHQAGNGVS
jgi:5-methylcytosine-specific restriction enzyme subunit McrC